MVLNLLKTYIGVITFRPKCIWIFSWAKTWKIHALYTDGGRHRSKYILIVVSTLIEV